MIAYVLGAGASAHARYPLAPDLLSAVAGWLDGKCPDEPGISDFRTRIQQLRAEFPGVDDFEEVLRNLDFCGQDRIGIASVGADVQCARDLLEDASRSLDSGQQEPDGEVRGFYPQYLRDDLASAVREFFYEIASGGFEGAYDNFAEHRARNGDTVITFNFDVSVERALRRNRGWDIASGYGFELFPNRPRTPVTVLKLHGSVNWFREPMQKVLPPLVFKRDLDLLGYRYLSDGRIPNDGVAVDGSTLILPSPNKRFSWEPLWEHLWRCAGERLRSAEEVFIHGYSMPLADDRARMLLLDNINHRSPVHVFSKGHSERVANEFSSRGFRDVRPNPTIEFETWAADRN